ncbi:putative toxin-antitoxin system toxin component, PIN family [Candidatus Micrarchaeota archaeon]|nr:putative toxin-antitoxin system toxin component, PIN family [Candidatus Micrarchaeota archaeon]
MAKVVFDTNVLFSAILSSSGSSSRLLKLASEGKITGFTSPALLGELDEVLQRDYGASQDEAAIVQARVKQALRTAEPGIVIDVIKEDGDDNRVLECAVASGANYVASWDPHLTRLKEFQGIKILNPGELLAELSGQTVE